MKIKCPECVKWNDVDFKDKEFNYKELVDHVHEIHDTTTQKEFIGKWIHLLFTINEVMGDGRTLVVVSDELKSILETEK